MNGVKRIFLVTSVLATLTLAQSAATQSLDALRGHDTSAPIEWTADGLEIQDRAQRAILTGNVVARQAGLTLTAARATVIYTTINGLDVDRVDASGNVTVRSLSGSAKGSFAIYDLDRALITLLGDVELKNEKATFAGQRLVIDLNSGRATLGGQGRVTGTFKVRKQR